MTLVNCFSHSCLKMVIYMLFIEKKNEDDWVVEDGEKPILTSSTDIWQLKQGLPVVNEVNGVATEKIHVSFEY